MCKIRQKTLFDLPEFYDLKKSTLKTYRLLIQQFCYVCLINSKSALILLESTHHIAEFNQTGQNPTYIELE